MTRTERVAPADIRRAKEENPSLRERDLARQLGISEAEYVAAWCGQGTVRIAPRVRELLTGLEAIGEVMALTRNDSAVHEKIGVYDKVVTGDQNALVLGEQIDLRIFPKVWAHGFAVEKREGGEVRRSLQFFDQAGEAVHKVHLRPASNLYAYQKLVESLALDDQAQAVDVLPIDDDDVESRSVDPAAAQELRERWSKMTDVHQFFGILRAVRMTRHQAVKSIGEDYAWQLDRDALMAMLRLAANDAVPIMCFVGSRGCIQIHSGPIRNIKPIGPWINILDETFNLHLRFDHVAELWAVRRPTKDGHVTSLEAYGEDKKLITQFFGQRHEGETERADWRMLAENLPRVPRLTAA
ncbi:ChuX/HutX family heme-like substrate-binding protein [Mesorhizobium sp. BAC0120]|uniref:hemin-degrading factor n=1 Tax=Mesorhizobium sp. BAC0120 TaxID=3090670 RepID=UPI00298C25E9|nr:ChuX/HutX family heme-like substrate-binding protein [Mesorhizobium sp. BAC0120]MDW6025836.1 ChuX/HutX family heme-like substrate-binding protein [Mesorhizobium sp. BAC0120]